MLIPTAHGSQLAGAGNSAGPAGTNPNRWIRFGTVSVDATAQAPLTKGGGVPFLRRSPSFFFFPRRLSLRHFFFSIVFLVFSIFIIRSILIIIIVFFDVLAFTGLNWVILGFLFQCFAFIFFQLFSWFHLIYAAADDGIVVVVVAAVVFVVVAVALVVVVVVVFAAPMPLSIFVIGKITFHISRISCRGYPTQLFF